MLNTQAGVNHDEIKLILKQYVRIGLTIPNFMQEEIQRKLR
jgi:hypothetical protein